MTPRLSLAPLSLPELTPDLFLRAAAAAGFSRVALRLFGGDAAKPRILSPALVESPAMVAELGRIAAGEAVAVAEIEVLMIGRSSDIAACEPMLAAAAGIGVGQLVACVVDEDLGRAAERVRDLALLARSHGIRLGLEFAPTTRLRSLDAALALIEATGEADIGIVVDALHLARSGGTAADVAAAPGDRLCLLQLCDAPLVAPVNPEDRMREARERRLVPGAGEIDLVSLVAAMPAGASFSVEVPDAERVARLGPVGHARGVREAAERLFAQAPPRRERLLGC
ncbi:sugar phosphate isomerase/epimerase family protein [Rhizorhabdus phycosphaerae]|uniref:sugar phosphate isomerase/epimerase family protein n=1 Tax=Rhizorhabdus phycosphaerae TaxID=2711156 RepID=UPI0013EC8F13|nr:sugar phosphate isomerase/epimerase [Rhizorhabdus phycosphaerae]